jgi:hypothetical protein
MAQTGYTPIQLYYSSTTTNVPLAANLASGELAINITDGKLFYKDNANAVQVIAWKTTPTTAGGTGLTSYTTGDLLYASGATTISKLGIGAANTVLTSSGSAPQWSAGLSLSTLTTSSTVTLNGGTANGVVYLNGSKVATSGSSFVFDGSNLVLGASSAIASGFFSFQYAGNAKNGLVSDDTDTGGGGNSVLIVRRNGTQIGSITTTSTTTAYNTSSDYRLKEDIQPMTGALAKVQALNPVTYKWKSNGSEGEGFIAHELQAVIPDCVTGEKDAVDDEGNPAYQGIDSSFLIATLTSAIKELQEKLKAANVPGF